MRSIILSRQDYREADQLITLFSDERGKEICFAKSVKKITSKNSPFLEPGVIAETDIVPADEFPKLIRATPLFVGRSWRSDYARLRMGAVILSISALALPTATPEKNVFTTLESWLHFLDEISTSTGMVAGATACILAVLSALGFQPITGRCVAGHAFSESNDLFFDPAQGGVLCEVHARAAGTPSLRLSYSDVREFGVLVKSSWSDIGELKLPAAVHQAVWSLGVRALDRSLPQWWCAGK